MSNYKNRLLSEHLRPKCLDDLTLPEQKICHLKRLVEAQKMMNLLFFGSPGIGKTSTALILINTFKPDPFILKVCGSDLRNNDQIEEIRDFAFSRSLFDQPKICLIDECDCLSEKTRISLQTIIEQSSENVRFILTANDINKMSKPLKSRLLAINFDVLPSERPAVLERLIATYDRKLRELDYVFNAQRLREIVYRNFPDMRSIANQLEFQFEPAERAA